MWPMAVASPQEEHRAMLDIHIILLYHFKYIVIFFHSDCTPAVRLARILTFKLNISFISRRREVPAVFISIIHQ